MKINRNMSAVITNRQLLRTENKLSASMERLSSGYKINKAGDNPAGMAISNKMKAQIDALDQAESNAADGESVLNIADGALNEVSSILQRMRELCVQAANGTNSESERESIQKEVDKLKEEVDRISADTEYNTKTLLDGSCDVRVYSKEVNRMDISDSVTPGTYTLHVDQKAQAAMYDIPQPTGKVDGKITINGVGVDYTKGMSEDAFFEQLRKSAEQAGCTVDRNANGGGYTISTTEYGSSQAVKVSMNKEFAEDIGLDKNADAKYDDKTGNYTLNKVGTDAQVSLVDGVGFSKTTTVSAEGTRIKVTDIGGFSMDFKLKENAQQDITIDVTDIGAMSIQIGANQYQDVDVRIPEISTESMYLDTVDVTVSNGPENGMRTLDDAIAKLSDVRSRIGAFTNRLQYAQNSLAETQEDLTAAYSNILDTDMAEEMTEFTQRNVLEQASISVLSQANDLPQQVLSLLQ
uniref:flagellin N-terminal helical domain-containing protein n=1 Tax=Agathobacter sp. TaxID=2021311 RepID=UPI00402745F7